MSLYPLSFRTSHPERDWIMLLRVLLCPILGFFALSASAQVAGDPRPSAVFNTWTAAPVVPMHPMDTSGTMHPNSGVGTVIVLPFAQDDPTAQFRDWRALRKQRLAILTADVARRINFEFDKADLDPEGLGAVADLASILHENPDIGVALSGYTDLVGTESYNDELSARRSDTVYRALLVLGVEDARMTSSSFGERFPLILTLEPNRENRRVESKLVDLFELPAPSQE